MVAAHAEVLGHQYLAKIRGYACVDTRVRRTGRLPQRSSVRSGLELHPSGVGLVQFTLDLFHARESPGDGRGALLVEFGVCDGGVEIAHFQFERVDAFR